MPYPEIIGQPCWSLEQVRKVISLTAQTNAESAPYFLAAHSPFERIVDAKSGSRQLTEEQVFQELFSPARGEIQAFVRGEPGTGKSHLIRWLKLRAEDAKARGERGFDSFKLVLVSRGNGSLKDALGKVVEQLGEEFSRHIDPIRGAIEKLSDHAARDTLLSLLALEIGTHWSTRHPEIPLPKALHHLAAALAPTTGFGAWMKRDGGVIHQVIRRLTEPSSADDREQFPSFSPDDFEIEITYLRPNTTPGNVIIYAEELMEDDLTRKLTAQFLNMALKDARDKLTGLSGSDLLEIFTKIRRELGPKKQLAIFIEDVSVGGLNEEIINAFEARPDDSLCRMVAVLGITKEGWDKEGGMADNQKQRANFIFEVGGQTAERWASDAQSVTAFAARYLNAVRMGDADIKTLAMERFSGDVSHSACDGCGLQDKCFESFGKTELPNGVKIGLFPFNPIAPKALLSSLSEGYYKSQRELLDRILLPALDLSYQTLQTFDFPQHNQFNVKLPSFRFDWAAFSARYLGGNKWDEPKKGRARFLTCYWTDAATVAEAASRLEPLLAPLGFPKFSSDVLPPQICQKCGKNPCACVAPPQICQKCGKNPCVCGEDQVLKGLLSALDNWFSGSKLSQDADFRKFVGSLLRNSIQWTDERGTPITVTKTGAQQLITGYAFVKIEDQLSRPATQTFFIDLNRSKETKEMLESLSHFERRSRSWQFPHSELHKRKISRWLRQNKSRVVNALRPAHPSLPTDSLRCAVQALALAAYLRDRCEIPSGNADRLDAVLKPLWDAGSKPTVFSAEFQSMVSDLEAKHSAIRSFVIKEVGAGQGDAEPQDFLDPLPLLEVIDDFTKEVAVEPPSSMVAESFWKNRFLPVSRLGEYSTLASRLQNERKALECVLVEVRRFIDESSAGGVNPQIALEACLKSLVEVINLHSDPNILPVPDPAFDNLWQRNLIQSSETRGLWTSAISKADEVVAQKSSTALLAFDPAKLKECAGVLHVVEKHLDLVDKYLKEEGGLTAPTGDTRKKLFEELGKIEQLSSSKEKGECA